RGAGLRRPGGCAARTDRAQQYPPRACGTWSGSRSGGAEMSDAVGLGRVLITGGASGLGAAVADGLAAAGGEPIVMDLVAPRRSHVHFAVDLADTAMTESVTSFIAADGLDAVVTCAAIDSCGPLETVKTEDWERVVQVNLMGTAAVIRASMSALLESQGQVVTVASTLGRRALPDASAYCASKF